MKVSKSDNDSQNERRNLKNFGLSVEEIKIIKSINDLTQTLEDIKSKNAQPSRLEFFLNEIRKLEDQLEEIRENTLIR